MAAVIASTDLLPEHLPDRDEGWEAFASTFDGYLHWNSFERCANIANSTAKQYFHTGTLPRDLDVLRTCLFFEQRRSRHSGYPPDKSDRTYTRALQEAIRNEVISRA